MRQQIHLFLTSLLVSLPLLAEPDHAVAGDSLPPINVRSADGAVFDLSRAVADQPAVVVFYRGGWCPFCTRHLMELGRVAAELRDLGFQILAVSPDRPAKIREAQKRAAELAPAQPGAVTQLSDSTPEAARALGISFQVEAEQVRIYRDRHGIDLEEASGETHHRLPHPSVFVVTRDQVIRFAHVDTDYRARLSGEEVLAAARTAKATEAQVVGPASR